MHTVDDFGFVVLDIDWLFPRDAGEFMCRATNKWGQDTTKAVLKIKSMSSFLILKLNLDLKIHSTIIPLTRYHLMQIVQSNGESKSQLKTRCVL